MSAPLLPPYPFPTQWDFVSKEQLKFRESFWLTSNPIIEEKKVKLPADFETSLLVEEPIKKRKNVDHCNFDFEHENVCKTESLVKSKNSNFQIRLELNSEWASRFSNTVKKMKNRKKQAWKSANR